MKLSDALEAVIDSYGVNDRIRKKKISPVWSSQNKTQPRTRRERDRDAFRRKLDKHISRLEKRRMMMKRGSA